MNTYPEHLARLRSKFKGDAIFQQAIGGNFEAVGKLELSILRMAGLKDSDSIVDVGCGSGRLAAQLIHLSEIKYLGTDVMAEALDYAIQICRRHDWTFLHVKSLSIPSENETADLVCFFSVITHLSHADSFCYLREAARVLRRGGKIVLSFLEFHIYSHWSVFEIAVTKSDPFRPLDQFISRDAVYVWAMRLGLHVELIADGDKATIPVDGEIRWDDGRIESEFGSLGQSYAILRKP